MQTHQHIKLILLVSFGSLGRTGRPSLVLFSIASQQNQQAPFSASSILLGLDATALPRDGTKIWAASTRDTSQKKKSVAPQVL